MFIGITGLIIPLLVLLIAPIALMIAVAYVLNKLSNDSELIVMNAAGMPPWRIFEPFLAVGIMVSLMVAAISVYVSPKGLRELRRWATEVRAEVVTNNVQPGRFSGIDNGLTLHIRSARPTASCSASCIDDRRDPKERVTILAEKGDILTNERGTYSCSRTAARSGMRPSKRDPDLRRVPRARFRSVARSRAGASADHATRCRSAIPGNWSIRPADDPLYKDQPGAVHRRASQPHHRAALSARLPGHHLRLSRRAAHDAAKPRHVVRRRDRGGRGSCARVGFVGTVVGDQRPITLLLPYVALAGAFALGIVGDRARRHPRAARLPHQHGQRGHWRACRAHVPGTRRGRRNDRPARSARYFGLRFLSAVVPCSSALLLLVAMVDYIEMMRRTSDMKDVSALVVAKISLYRVPYLTERVLPFAVLSARCSATSICRGASNWWWPASAGMSAWQFVAPAP